MLHPQSSGGRQMVRNRVGENIQGALHPRGRGNRGTGRTAQIGIVEIGQPVGGRPNLAPHPTFLPGQTGFLGAHPDE